MSIQKLMASLYSAGACVLAGLVLVTTLLIQNQTALGDAQQTRYESYLLADELRQSSDDLTRLARTYVVTGDSRHEKSYWTALEVRNGKSARADGRTIALQQLMKDAGFMEAELEKLREAERNSNGLVTTETIAMNAVKGLYDDGTGRYSRQDVPDPDMARRIMFDDQYHANKALIMAPIVQFERMLNTRTQADVERYEWRSFVYLGLLAVLVVAGGIIAFLVVRSTRRTLADAANELRRTVGEVTAASTQVAASSQTLSEGATTQAASLEETSASMEEMASMTRQNAENSTQAAAMMADSERLVSTANDALGGMVASMTAIRDSSDKVGRIIRTIDEIAFQTNILALNAAVEAARAGEAGMGFAVVSDEVRALAQRSAQAAKDTALLIEESIANAHDGQKKVHHVSDAIASITASTNRVRGLVDQVSEASRQQAQGISQVSQAIAQMESVTQTTAAMAEESAAASVELNAQAGAAMDVIARLAAFVGGGTTAAVVTPPQPDVQAIAAIGPRSRVVPMNGDRTRGRSEAHLATGDATGTYGSF